MSRLDCYKHLDKESKLKVEIDMPSLARHVNQLNYGTHRLLSALVHELRYANDKWVAEYTAKYGKPTEDRSELADGIEELLNKGYFK